MSVVKTLLSRGAEVTAPLQYHKERDKMSGGMWSGKMELKHEDVVYYLKLWTHFPHDRDMTEDEVLDILHINALEMLNHPPDQSSLLTKNDTGRYYDGNWHTVRTDNRILLHRQGWISDAELEEFVESITDKLRYKIPCILSSEDEARLIDHGFELVLSISESELVRSVDQNDIVDCEEQLHIFEGKQPPDLDGDRIK